MSVLCVDAGTTMVKSVLVGEGGVELAVARSATVVSRPRPGWSEQDMYSVWDAVVHTIRSVVHSVGEHLAADPVEALAITGQGDGCWLVGEDGRPTGPAILWNDARATAAVDAWDADGRLAEAYRINGNLGFAGTQSAILDWLRAEDPDRLERSHKALYCTGWLHHRMTGTFGVEISDAASPFLDIAAGSYSRRIRELFDLEWAERLLPDVLSGADRCATLLDLPATELRLPPGLPVILAPFDIPATAIGIGAVSPGQGCSILGTTLSTEVPWERPDTSGTPSGMILPLGVPGRFLRSLPAMAGADVITWGMRLIGLDDPNWLSDLAGLSTRGANGLVFHPYLAPSGERAPFRDSQARGSIIGLSFEHSRRDIARALLEGLSFVIRDCLHATEASVEELRLCGGGANSSFWCQLLADVTGAVAARSADSEIGAKGAYLTARSILDSSDIASLAAAQVTIRDRYEPDPAATAAYDDLFGEFLGLRTHARAGWPALAGLRERHATSVVN